MDLRYTLIAALLLSSCSADFPQPETLDAAPIYGCYSAPDAPSFTVGPDGVRTPEIDGVTSFHYEMHRIGAMLRVPLNATFTNGKFGFKRSEDRVYRVVFRSGRPVVLVAFGNEGILKEYDHHPTGACAD